MYHTLGIDRCMCVGFLYTLMVRQPSGSLSLSSLLCLHGEADGRLLVVKML